jgi:hypothetical protein
MSKSLKSIFIFINGKEIVFIGNSDWLNNNFALIRLLVFDKDIFPIIIYAIKPNIVDLKNLALMAIVDDILDLSEFNFFLFIDVYFAQFLKDFALKVLFVLLWKFAGLNLWTLLSWILLNKRW